MLAKWSKVTYLDFVETSSNEPDIKIIFAGGYHQDPYQFDGRGGTLAHAFYPLDNKGKTSHSPYLETSMIASSLIHTRSNPQQEWNITRAKSLSTVLSHMPNRNFVVATLTLATDYCCFHKSAFTIFFLWDISHASAARSSVFRTQKSCIARAIPNTYEQSLMQKRVHVQIDDLAPISSGHGL